MQQNQLARLERNDFASSLRALSSRSAAPDETSPIGRHHLDSSFAYCHSSCQLLPHQPALATNFHGIETNQLQLFKQLRTHTAEDDLIYVVERSVDPFEESKLCCHPEAEEDSA